MSRARELFDRLQQGGTTALDELIADREPESLFLDFKRSEDDGRGTTLAKSDNKNLSKAISGFANSSGGVVVWGVDCRRDASGSEVAKPHCLEDAKGFETKLQSAVSRTTMPAFSGVEFHAFVQADDNPAGFVAMYVPQSFIGPIRGLVGEQYYIRAGSDFVPAPHDVLAGMFGRAPQPQIGINLIQYQSMLDERDNSLTAVLGIVAVNLGAVIGERPYLSLKWHGPAGEGFQLQSPDPDHIRVRRGPLPSASILTREDFVLAPNASEELCKVYYPFYTNAPQPFALEAVLGVRGAPPLRVTIEASLHHVNAVVAKVRKSGNLLNETPFRLLS